jgi:hypothetical protein
MIGNLLKYVLQCTSTLTKRTMIMKPATKNYTPEMETQLMEAVPFNADKAQEFADLFGKARGSVIAKIKSMEAKILKDNPEAEKLYIVKAPYVTKGGADVEKKADIVKDIETLLNINAESLVKSSKADLVRVRAALESGFSQVSELS